MSRPSTLGRNISNAAMMSRQDITRDAMENKAAYSVRLSSFSSHDKKNHRKRNVVFVKDHSYFYIETLDELTKEDIDTIWFTEEESADMKNDAYSTVAALDAGLKDIEARGLENQTEQGAWTAYKARKDGYDIVLGEIEDAIRARKEIDYEKIAKMYTEGISKQSHASAAALAKQDEEYARAYCKAVEDELEHFENSARRESDSLPSLAESAVSDEPEAPSNETASPMRLKRYSSFGEASCDSTASMFGCEMASDSDDESDSEPEFEEDLSEDSDASACVPATELVENRRGSLMSKEYAAMKLSKHLARPRRISDSSAAIADGLDLKVSSHLARPRRISATSMSADDDLKQSKHVARSRERQ